MVTPTLVQAAELIGHRDFEGARLLLADAVRWLPADGPDGLSARQMLAEVLRELGRVDEAYGLAAQLAQECRRRFGPADPMTVRALVVLGALLHDRGALDEAERQYLHAVHGGAKVDGPAGRTVLLAMANLALVYRDQGDPDLAVQELADAYGTHSRLFGPADPGTVQLREQLGRLHASLGDEAAAQRVLADSPAKSPPSPPPPPPPPPAPAAPPAPVEDQPVYRPGAVEFPAEPWGSAGDRAVPASRRGLVGLVFTIAAVLGVGALVAVVLATGGRHAPSTLAGSAPPALPSASATPSQSSEPDEPRPPPGDVRLRDDGKTITVTWTDPSAGTGTVLLAVSHGGQPAGPLRPLPAGTRRQVLTGLNPLVNYCVIIAIVYPGDTIARADQVCTTRPG